MVYRTNIDCCKDCLARHSNCHPTCKLYQKQKAELEETNKRKAEKYIIEDYKMKSRLRHLKRRRK